MRLVSAIYGEWFPFDSLPAVKETVVTTNPAQLREGDVLLVWGGEDISPMLYDKPASMYSGSPNGISRRDRIEWDLMRKAVELEVPIIGVCRGAQMLCALSGGHLLQHVTDHGRYHNVTTIDGQEFATNSCHHQMMYPFDVRHEMLASVKPGIARYHYDVNDVVDVTEEPEMVYYPDTKGIAIQWHPEWMDLECEATQYALKAIESRL